MGVIQDLLHAIYEANTVHASNDPSVFVHGTMSLAGGITISSSTLSIGSVGQSGSWTTAIRDSSGNSILATNTNPVGTEQGMITRIAGAQGLQGAAVPTGPVTIGGEARTSDPTAVANAQLIRILLDSLGKIVSLPGAINDLHLNGQANIAQVAAAAVIPSQGAGKKIVLQSILVSCSGSQTVQVIVSGGANSRTFGYAFPGSGFAKAAGGAALYITSASSALSVAGDVTSTMNIYATGYSIGN